jgi:hypothetical protein
VGDAEGQPEAAGDAEWIRQIASHRDRWPNRWARCDLFDHAHGDALALHMVLAVLTGSLDRQER